MITAFVEMLLWLLIMAIRMAIYLALFALAGVILLAGLAVFLYVMGHLR